MPSFFSDMPFLKSHFPLKSMHADLKLLFIFWKPVKNTSFSQGLYLLKYICGESWSIHLANTWSTFAFVPCSGFHFIVFLLLLFFCFPPVFIIFHYQRDLRPASQDEDYFEMFSADLNHHCTRRVLFTHNKALKFSQEHFLFIYFCSRRAKIQCLALNGWWNKKGIGLHIHFFPLFFFLVDLRYREEAPSLSSLQEHHGTSV